MDASRYVRERTLQTWHAAMVLVGVCYALAGTWKIIGAIVHTALGNMHNLSPEALSQHIAWEMYRANRPTLFGEIFVEYPLLGWPGMLGVILLQVTAVVAAFRPALHRLWGVGLLGFHGMVSLTMGFSYAPFVLCAAFFFLLSPFAPTGLSLGEMLRQVPLLGRLLPQSSR